MSEKKEEQSTLKEEEETPLKESKDEMEVQVQETEPRFSITKFIPNKILALFGRATYAEERTIYVGEPEKNSHFINNFIKTSKYTFYNFIFKYLLEQFMRVANFYFLIITALQLIPGLSPTGQFTTLFGLLIVLTLNAIKEILEDVKRHRQDNEVNNRLAKILKNDTFVDVKWSDIYPGMIVYLESGHSIPADIVVLNTSEPLAICYIETSSLDGETNLKIRQSHPATTVYTKENIMDFKAKIQCENRNAKLYDFDGNFTMDGNKILPLTATQLLLRGSSIQNTEWVLGVVINTGYDTKLVLNSTSSRLKKSNVELKTNFQIFFIFILLGIMCIICTIGSLFFNSGVWYLNLSSSGSSGKALEFFTNLGTFIVLYNNLVPISLYVSMEFVKFGQAYFINNDITMYDKRTDTPAQARTSNLNEELGQVQYIFTDKTGTLTRNQMQFKNCSIAGIIYGGPLTLESINDIPQEDLEDPFVNFPDPSLLNNLKNEHSTASMIREFLILLSVCHTVIPQIDDNGKLQYQAASPDEAALVRAARQLGYVFTKRTPEEITISVEGKEKTYKILNVIEFNSTRKRMSIIVRTPENKLILYCKGADSVIYERLGPTQSYKEVTEEHLKQFAAVGLRTLCLSYKELDETEYSNWAKLYDEASVSIKDREKKVTEIAEKIETDLFLIGATAIEDRLQDGVPESIQILRQAGIKIWMLTGDKQETAINIGFSCNLLNDDMNRIILNCSTKEELISLISENNKKYEAIVDVSDELGLVINGDTLHFALEDEIKQDFLKLATKCKSVICCRVSPLQKALVVALVKDNLKSITLSIGDGGNDVSMITTAHVGIGISGEEGLQAARASDYAIAQFRFLVPLLLIHGRYAYRAISRLIQYSFYKNIVLVFTQFWFTLFNGFSGQTLYEKWTLSLFNVAFAFTPIITLGIFDRDFDRKTVMDNPQLYLTGQRNELFRNRVMLGWITNGVYHSIIVFFLTMAAYIQDVEADGRNIGMWGWGITTFTVLILVLTFKVCLETRRWVWLHHLSVWGTLAFYFGFQIVYAVFNEGYIALGVEIFFTFYYLLGSSKFYYCIIIIPIIALFRDYTFK